MKSAEALHPAQTGLSVGVLTPMIEIESANARCARCDAEIAPEVSEDARLVQACLSGDQQAWEMLIDKYKRLIYSVPFKYGASPEDAADIFQSVCIEVFNSLGQLKHVESLRSWLITVSVRQSYRWKKKQARHVELDALEPDVAEELATVPETVQQLQQEQIVREVVAKLPPRCGELVRMLFFEQPPLPYTEVARRLGLATGSIGFMRGRALERLRKMLVEAGFHVPERAENVF
ncbi:MAG TPA: sigma-70 family RNA polymerase sigma factor [Candidatus Angelobacter sp.]|jgi:RNA polymerase sigma factor (sigma-70 family)|nr:sigma-70 family RNA polymerase sigma factor [Candidatus Angelobacter sp.]